MKTIPGILLSCACAALALAGCRPAVPADPVHTEASLLPVVSVTPKRAPRTTLAPRPRRLAMSGQPRNKLSAHTARAMELAEQDRYWLAAQGTVRKRVVELISQREEELRRGLRHNILLHGDRRRPEIALTFDDGPHPGYTERLLQVLGQYHVPATFFVVGQMAEQYPDLVRQEVEDGHEVANHTYHHVSLPKVPEEYVATEIKACGEVLQSITGRAPHLFRPPGGRYNDGIARISEALGYRMVLWTDDPGDYESPGEKTILHDTLEDASNGGIILLHDGIEETIRVLPALIKQLRAAGYRFVPLETMLHPAQPATGIARRRGGLRGT